MASGAGSGLLEPEEEKISAKADAFEAMLESDGVELEEVEIIESNDVNGPWVPVDDPEFNLKEHLEPLLESIDLGDKNHATLTSGHPDENLRVVRDERMGNKNIGIIGEMGSVYRNGDGVELVHPEYDPRELWSIHRDIYESAAEEEVKVLPQNNISNVVGCVRVEGEGGPNQGADVGHRSGLYLDEEVWDQSLDEIAEELENYSGFDYNGEKVVFENNLKNAAILTDILREEFRYPGLRFEKEGDRIAFYRDRNDDPDMTLEEAKQFVIDSVPEGVEYVPNDDWGVDIIVTDEVSKENGIRAYAEDHLGGDDYIITHTGDKETDVIEGEKAYNFPLQGSEAHEYCLENGVPHIPVADGGEYISIHSEVLDRR